METEENKKTRKSLEEIKGLLEMQREKELEKMKFEIFLYHNFHPTEVSNYKIHHLGVTPAEPELKYDVSYSLDNLVKKAGDNLILDVGKLIGVQWVPTDMERKRILDSYLPSKRIFENDISVTIPTGYRVTLPDSSGFRMENRYGAFDVSLSIRENVLNIRTCKRYKESFIPVKDFPLFLEMMDKANEFFSTSIVLEKK